MPLAVAGVAAVLLAGTAAVLGARNAAERDRAVAAEWESRQAEAAADGALSQAVTSQAGAALQAGPRGFAALSPDGRLVGTTRDDTLELYDRDGVLQHTLRSGGPRLQDAAFSPDSRWVAAGVLGGDIWIWRWPGRTLAARLRAHSGRIASVEFSRDGHTLLSGSWDATARLWDLRALDADPGRLRADAEAAWGMDLTAALEEEAR